MKTTSLGARLLALFLTLCTLVGMFPAVAVFAKAEEATFAEAPDLKAQTQEKIDHLTEDYKALKIPPNRRQLIGDGELRSLEGTYFMALWTPQKGYVMPNFGGNHYTYASRMTANSYSGNGQPTYSPEVLPGMTVGVVNGGNTSVEGDTYVSSINNTTPTTLDYAVEITKNTVPYTHNTTSWDEGVQGWANYATWEFQHYNSWSNNQWYGAHLSMKSQAYTDDVAYNIRSLHPNRAGSPYLYSWGSGQMLFNSSPFPFFFKTKHSSHLMMLYKIDIAGANLYTYWLGADVFESSNYFIGATLSQIVREDRNYNASYNKNRNAFHYDWEFFRISPRALGLYKTLMKAKNYVDAKNPNGIYPEQTYLNFLKYVDNVIDIYNANYSEYNEEAQDGIKAYLDAVAKDLESYMALLEIEKNPESYMDISMEVLDFRADGLLFEGVNATGTAYSLSTASGPVGSVEVPGTPQNGDTTGSYLKGLIEPNLVKGQIVYTLDTIGYIATALHKQHHTFADSSVSLPAFDSAWNNVFMDRVSKPGAPMPMGSWEDTKTKIQGGANGGIMSYTAVTTCYDLAYYMLTNIWRETPEKDIVDTARNLPYNTKISELHTMRLIKNAEGKYAFQSDLENGRNLDSGLVFNYPTRGSAGSMLPTMNAAADLGFEKTLGNNTTGGVEGDATTYGRRNYHLMYHMQSAFVYYESKNLSFSFSGDDDVYFFINGELVCDIGGMHVATDRKIELNGSIAKDLGLEDGDICTFDMFLAERHTANINLNLITNIEMMPVDAVTEKVQYFYTAPGTPEAEIREGAAVADGTEVGYGFKLLNRCDYGVQNLSFIDKALGVDLSGNGLSLGGHADAEDLTLVYTTYNPVTEQLCDAVAQPVDYDSFQPLVEEAINNMSEVTPLDDGVYCMTNLAVDQITELLKLGLPANTQLAIYGFHRTVNATTKSYTNTVYTSCTPIRGRSGDTFLYGDPIMGSARRNLTVQAMDAVTADPFRVVLDYGKPVEFTRADILDSLTYNSRVVNVSFMGIRLGGEHGSTSPFKPSYLYLEKDGDTLTTDNGIYERKNNTTIRFTPSGFLESVDRLYGYLAVTDSTTGSSWYLTAAIDVVPANIVYYEGETFVGSELQTLKKDATGSVDWNDPVSDDTQEPEGEPQDLDRPGVKESDMVVDREYIPGNAFFVDFDGLGYKERYQFQPQYGGYDFDKSANWSVYVDPNNGAVDTRILGVDTAAGTLTFEDAMTTNSSGQTVDWNYIHTGPAAGSAILRYAAGENDFLQIRMKLENGTATGKNFTLSLELNDGTTAKYMGTGTFSAEEYLDGNYHVFTVPLTHADYEGTLTHVRPIIHGIQNCKVTVDYIYIGPEEGQPHNMYADYLLFNFNDTPSDARRYQGKYYGGYNYDKPASWDAPADHNGGIQIENGTAILEDYDRTAEVRWDYIETKGASNMPLSYKITKNDVLQVRLKIEGGAEIAADKPEVRVEFMTSEGLKHAGHVKFNYNNNDGTPGLMNVVSGQYYTFTVPLNDGEYLNRTTLQSIRFVIYNIEGTDSQGRYDTTTIDYIYVGPEHLLGEINKTHDYLFFDFTNTNGESLRYGNPVYGSSTYNYSSSWGTDEYTTISGIDSAAGTITFRDNTTAYNWNFIQPGANNNWSLNYKPGKNDVMQVRMKVTPGNTSNTHMIVRMESNKGNGVLTYGEASFSSAYMDGQYHIFTVPLTGAPYQNLVTGNGVLDGFRLVIFDAEEATFTVDYIYIGPLKEANPACQSLFFGFDNSGEDQLRYDSRAYGKINFDRWSADNANNKANWATAYGASGSGTAVGGNGDDFAINNQMGTITVYPDDEVSYDDNQIFRVDLQPTVNYKKYLYSKDLGMPLYFRPDRADVIQIRLRLENCSDGSSEDKFINDEIWNETEGDQWDTPRVEIRVNYYQDQQRKSLAPNTYSANLDTTSTEYQTITIPLGDHLAKADFVECMSLRFFHIKDAGNGKIVIDYIYVGPGEAQTETVYGYDSSYTDDEKLSDGKSLYVEGNGVKLSETTAKYTEAEFSFNGTGFDLISRTGAQQATIRVSVYDDPGKAETSRIKTLTVNNKGELELYQIPVVSVQGLEHGTYYVSIWVNDKVTAAGLPQLPGVDLSGLTRGNQFYLDAIRIYDPIDVSGDVLSADQTVALNAYKADKEAYNYIKEIRNILLTKDAFDTLSGTLPGAVFVDVNSSQVDADNGNVTGTPSTDYTTVKVETYNKLGPKNEVYLAPGQAIAFRLAVDTNMPLGSLDVGAKIIQTQTEAKLTMGFVMDGNAVEGKESFTVKSATAQYHAVDAQNIRFLTSGSTKEVYFVIYNDAEGGEDNVISITDVKVAYEADPNTELPEDAPNDPEVHKRNAGATEPVRFLIDGNAATAIATFLQGPKDEPVEGDKPEQDEPTEEDKPVVVEDVSIYHNLNLASDISVNYVVEKAAVEGYENLCMTVTVPTYEGNALVGSTTLSLAPVDKGVYYYFTLTGLTAVRMNDTVEAVLTMIKDGKSYVTLTDTYSVAEYAYRQLNNATAQAGLKPLCAELLRYGASAQIFKGYRTDSLVDADMTEEQKALLSDLEAVTFDNCNTVTDEVADSGIAWVGKSLSLDSKVVLRYILDMNGYTGEISDLSVVATYIGLNGEEKTVSLGAPVLYHEGYKFYSADFDGLLAAELRQPVRVAVYCGETRLTGVLEYSASTYGAGKTGALGDLCRCLMAYSDSAKAFFR